ncbi:MAG TPA: tetratricopeptide repeat protein [Allosphingosinicella sp.]|jgi:tetratricopeptide (TPR) repeat protein
MKKILLAVSAMACLSSAPASAGVVVVGTSPARGCFESARAENGSEAALRGCNDAFASGMLSFYETVATHVNRGIVRLFGNDTSGAIADFDRAIALDPSEGESYLNKGAAYLKLERNAEARALFDEALQRRTKRPELAYFGRAIANETTGDIRAAYLDYQRAQAAAPRWQEPARELTRFQVRRAGGSL